MLSRCRSDSRIRQLHGGDFVGYKYPTYKFWIIKGRLKIFQTTFFFISLYSFSTLSFKVFNTLFTVLILVSTSSI